MKKLLHIIDSLDVGGAEKLLVTVINGLKDKYDQHLILLNKPDTLINELPASCKVTVLNFKSYRNLLATKKEIRFYIKSHGIGIVHSQLYWSNIISRMAATRKVKVFNTIQAISSEASYKVNRLSLYLEKLTYRKNHYIIGVSKTVLNDFDEWVGLKGPSTVLYNIIEDKFFAAQAKSNFTKDALKMVAVGNLRWQKNYPYIIEAFKKMPSNVSLDIYGEGILRNELQAAIDKDQLKIRLRGHHHCLEKILPEYDIFLMCSLYEGFSLGLMEAMASGLVPVLTNIPVLVEAADDSAVYVDINEPADLSDKTRQILNGSIDLIPLAKKAHARAAALALKETHLQQLEILYNQ